MSRSSSSSVKNLRQLVLADLPSDHKIIHSPQTSCVSIVLVERKVHPGFNDMLKMVESRIRDRSCGGGIGVDGNLMTTREASILILAFAHPIFYDRGWFVVEGKHLRPLQLADSIGFLVANEKEKEMHVELICSWMQSGTGALLMASIERAALQRKKPIVTLDALGEAIGFYRHLGYVNNDVGCQDTPNVAKQWARLIQQYGKRPLDNDAAFTDFDQLLSDEGLQVSVFNTPDNDAFLHPMRKCVKE